MMLNPLKDTLGDDIQRVDGRRSIQPDTLDEQKFFYSFSSRLLTLVMLLYIILISKPICPASTQLPQCLLYGGLEGFTAYSFSIPFLFLITY